MALTCTFHSYISTPLQARAKPQFGGFDHGQQRDVQSDTAKRTDPTALFPSHGRQHLESDIRPVYLWCSLTKQRKKISTAISSSTSFTGKRTPPTTSPSRGRTLLTTAFPFPLPYAASGGGGGGFPKIRETFLSSTHALLSVVLRSVVKRAGPLPSLLLFRLKACARSWTDLRTCRVIGGSESVGAPPRSATKLRMCPTIISRLRGAAACRALRAFLPPFFFFVDVNGSAAAIRASSRRCLRSAFFARSRSH
jgi:hypothetical protein